MSARHTMACMAIYAVLAMCSWAQTLTVDVTPGFDGICPGEGCYSVTVYVQGERANAPPAVAEVEVVANSWQGSNRARKAVTLTGGLVSQSLSFLLCTRDEPYEVTARLILRGRVLAMSKPVPVTMARWFPLLVGLGAENTAFAHLPQRSLGVVTMEGRLVPVEQVAGRYEPPSFSSYTAPGSEQRRLFIGRVRTTLPPDSALAYRGVAVVSLDDRAWDTLTERQQNALIGYVLSGGLLVVHGVDITRLQTLAPSGLLPVEPLGLSRVPASALTRWVPSLGRSADGVDVVRSRVLGGSQVLLQYADIPLVVAMPKGFGQVVFLAFDPSQPPFTNSDAVHSLWKNLLRLQVNRFLPPTALFPDEPGMYWQAAPVSRSYSSGVVRAMVRAVAAKPVPIGWLITYLGVYILVLIPLNYLVLRKMDRLQWSWFTLPTLAVLTSVGGYAMAAQVQTSSHQLRWWTALYTAEGSPQAVVESDWVLYSAHTQRYRLQAKVDGIIVENSPSDLQAQYAVEIPQQEPADIRDVPIPLWSARSFHLSGFTSLQGAVSVVTRRSGDALQVNVRNGTPYTLKNLHVIVPSGVIPLGETCPAGGQKSLRVRTTDKLFMPRLPDGPELLRHGMDTGMDTENWREQAMQGWLGVVWTRLNVQAALYRYPPMPSRRRTPMRIQPVPFSRGVLVAEVEGFPQPAEVTPLSSSSVQQATVLAVAFDMQGGGR